MKIWIPVEVPARQLARLIGKDESKAPEAPQFERIPSWFGYTVRRKSEAT